MSRSYKVYKYEPEEYGCDSGMGIYRIEIKYNNADNEGIEFELVDGGSVLEEPLKFCSRGFSEDYVFHSGNYSVSTRSTEAVITFQDLVCCHMTENWNCSMRDLEIYYNLYLSCKGVITKEELFKIVDKILGE